MMKMADLDKKRWNHLKNQHGISWQKGGTKIKVAYHVHKRWNQHQTIIVCCGQKGGTTMKMVDQLKKVGTISKYGWK